ncbi:MAG: glycerophosphodiester phosphodiesterase family protein [Pseudomonadota bacterium]
MIFNFKKCSVVFCLLILTFNNICYAEVDISRIKRVAHAGGGIQGSSYTNSLEALDLNYNQGFELFEIDFSFTKDGYLVCIHDWSTSFEDTFKFKTSEKPSLEIFKFLVKNASTYQACTIDDLNLWLKKHPKAKIITDVKDGNLKALKIISKQIDNFQNIIIPQCYLPKNYTKIKKLGYKNIIWTLYRFQGDNQSVMGEVDKMDGLFAITMPTFRARSGLAKLLLAKNIPSYVHTINLSDQLKRYVNKYGVTNVYTDFLSPTKNTSNFSSKTKLVAAKLNNDCIAKYSLVEGSFYVPCVLVPDSPKPYAMYDFHMQQKPSKQIFQLNSYNLKSKKIIENKGRDANKLQ